VEVQPSSRRTKNKSASLETSERETAISSLHLEHLLDQPHLQKSRVAKVHNSKPQSGQHQLMEHGYSVRVPTAMNGFSCVSMHATTETTIAQVKLKVQTRQALEHTSNLLARNRKAFSCQGHQYPTVSERTDVC
jgi:hypothetical protein